MHNKQNITGLILAGGEGRRVGCQDKGLLEYNGKKLIEHQIEWLEPQVGQLLISANRNLDVYKTYGFKVLVDETELSESQRQSNQTSDRFDGPLQGVLQGLKQCETSQLFVHPVDVPLLPSNVVSRLQLATKKANNDYRVVNSSTNSAFLKTEQREHFLSLLIHTDYTGSLQNYLANGRKRVGHFLKSNQITGIDIGVAERYFLNLNQLENYRNTD